MQSKNHFDAFLHSLLINRSKQEVHCTDNLQLVLKYECSMMRIPGEGKPKPPGIYREHIGNASPFSNTGNT